MTGELSWEDFDGCTFEIAPCAKSDWPIVASISASHGDVFVDEMDARVLIGWLQRRLEQASSNTTAIPHTLASVNDDSES